MSDCFLLFITGKQILNHLDTDVYFKSCFCSVLILLDMVLPCGSAPNSSLACDSFTLEQYMHTHTRTHARTHARTHTHTHTHNYRYIQWIQFLKYTRWDRDRQTEKSCTVLTTDGVVPHQNLFAVRPNPAFLTDVVHGRCGLEFNLIKKIKKN